MNNLDFTMIDKFLVASYVALLVFDFHGVILDLSDAVIYEQPHSALHAVGGMTVSFQSMVKLATKHTSTMLSK